MAFDFETFGGDEPQEPQVQEAGEFAFEAFGGTEAPPRIEPPKSKTEKIIVEATKTKRKASTPVLGILAALPQAVGQVFTKREFAKTQIELQKNRQEAIKAAQGFIDQANKSQNPDERKRLLGMATNAMKIANGVESLVEDLGIQAQEATRIRGPLGINVEPLPEDVGEAATTIAGRGITGVGVAGLPVTGLVGGGALAGAGTALEQGKTPLGVATSAAGGAIGGRIAGAVFGAAAGTQLGQRVLTSAPVQAFGRVISPFFAKSATPGTIGANVDAAFHTFARTIDKVLTPGTYLSPVGRVGQAVGILKTPEQKLIISQKKITNWWDNTKSRYQAAVKFDKNSPEILGREGIIPKAKGGVMLTNDSAELVASKAASEKAFMNKILDQTGGYANLETVRQEGIRNITQNFKGLERQQAVRTFERQLDALINDLGKNVVSGAAGERLIPLRDLNDMKAYMWSRGYPQGLKSVSDALKAETSRLGGNAMKNVIASSAESFSPGAKEVITNLNNRLGDLYQAETFLRAMNGKKLPFGAIGRSFARVTGAIIGGHGGIPGAIGGTITADKLVDVLQNPKYTIGQATNYISRAKVQAPQALIETQRIIEKMAAERAVRPLLKTPQNIPLGPRTPVEPKFTQPPKPGSLFQYQQNIEADKKAAALVEREPNVHFGKGVGEKTKIFPMGVGQPISVRDLPESLRSIPREDLTGVVNSFNKQNIKLSQLVAGNRQLKIDPRISDYTVRLSDKLEDYLRPIPELSKFMRLGAYTNTSTKEIVINMAPLKGVIDPLPTLAHESQHALSFLKSGVAPEAIARLKEAEQLVIDNPKMWTLPRITDYVKNEMLKTGYINISQFNNIIGHVKSLIKSL